MERRNIKILELLEALQKKSTQSQRELAGRLNLSLGMVNKLIQDLTSQGFLKTHMFQKNKVRYMLTSKGVAEQITLKKQHLSYYISYYNEMKGIVKQGLNQLKGISENCILFYRAGALCEIACMLLDQNKSCNIKIIDDQQAGKTINGFSVLKESEMENMVYDAIMIMEPENTNQVRSMLADKGIPTDKIFQIIAQDGIADLEN